MAETKPINEQADLKGHFHYLSANEIAYRHLDKNYTATIQETDDPKILKVIIKGKSYQIKIENELDLLIADMGLNVLDAKDAGDIMSPMPGLVLDVLVAEGDTVKGGQSVAILEAMKMENIIKTAGKGIIESIAISKGDKVEKGQLLISIKALDE